MLPVTRESRDEFENRFEPDVEQFEEFHYLSKAMISFAIEFSDHEPISYVESEYFGGEGEQWSIIWHCREVRNGPD